VLQLVALEWLQPITDETTKPLTLFGQTFHGPNIVEGVPFPCFALHVWAWKDNSNGLFDDANPQVNCR
jgi:hypothetical protein